MSGRYLKSWTMLAGAVIIAPVTAFGQGASLLDGRPQMPPGGIELSAYDPHGDFSADANVGVEHLFLPWEDIDLSTLAIADAYARERNRTLLMTIEPWTWDQDKRIEADSLQRGIMDGTYDVNIAAFCGEVGGLGTPTTIRWAQEMEDTVGRFPWAGWAPQDYIAAYRKFVAQCRELAPNARFMWSPKGLPNLADYYPGDDVVDDVGLSVFGLQEFDNDKFGRDQTFSELLQPGYDLALQFEKPIYVAELGYVGDINYVTDWAQSVLQPHPQFPELVGVSYFNDKEVFPWPEDYGLPDWRVTVNILD